jgi:pilus assembly protein FimV
VDTKILRKCRYFRIAVVFASLLVFTGKLAALGVSGITVHSKLGAPLSATIQLSHIEELSDAEIIVRNAPEELYKKLGVERKYFYQGLQFNLDGKNIVITTRDSIKEPFLNFVLQFRWPEGELVREYKILIDPDNR